MLLSETRKGDPSLPCPPALERMLLQQPPKGPVSEIPGINAAGLEVVKGKKRGETLLAALPKQRRLNALPPLLLYSHCSSIHLSPTLGSILQAALIHYSFIQSVIGSRTPSFLLSLLDCLSPHSLLPSFNHSTDPSLLSIPLFRILCWALPHSVTPSSATSRVWFPTWLPPRHRCLRKSCGLAINLASCCITVL